MEAVLVTEMEAESINEDALREIRMNSEYP